MYVYKPHVATCNHYITLKCKKLHIDIEQTYSLLSMHHGELWFGHLYKKITMEKFSRMCQLTPTTLLPNIAILQQQIYTMQNTSYAKHWHIHTTVAARCFWIWQETMKHMMGKQPWVKTHKCCPEHRCLVRHSTGLATKVQTNWSST